MKERAKLKNAKKIKMCQAKKCHKIEELVTDADLLDLLKWMFQIDQFKRPTCE